MVIPSAAGCRFCRRDIAEKEGGRYSKRRRERAKRKKRGWTSCVAHKDSARPSTVWRLASTKRTTTHRRTICLWVFGVLLLFHVFCRDLFVPCVCQISPQGRVLLVPAADDCCSHQLLCNFPCQWPFAIICYSFFLYFSLSFPNVCVIALNATEKRENDQWSMQSCA